MSYQRLSGYMKQSNNDQLEFKQVFSPKKSDIQKIYINFASETFLTMKHITSTIMMILLLTATSVTAASYTMGRVSVHDPSVVWNPQNNTYYIFGSHRAAAKSTDLMNWASFRAPWQTATSNRAANSAAFTTPQVTKVKKNGVEVDLPLREAATATPLTVTCGLLTLYIIR